MSIESLFPGTHNDGASQEHAEAVHLFDEIRILTVNGAVPGYFPAKGPFTEKFYGEEEQEQLEDSRTLDLVKGERKGRKLGLKQCMGQIKIGEGSNVPGSQMYLSVPKGQGAEKVRKSEPQVPDTGVDIEYIGSAQDADPLGSQNSAYFSKDLAIVFKVLE